MIFVVFFISFLQFGLSSSLVMHIITAFIFICFFFVLSIIICPGQFVPSLRDKRLKEYRIGLPAVGRLSSRGGGRGGGGGYGYSTNVYTGRLRPEVQPLTLLYTIFHAKGTPF